MINDIDINKIVVSNKLPFGKQNFKYFMGYKDSENVRPCSVHIWLYIKEILMKLKCEITLISWSEASL